MNVSLLAQIAWNPGFRGILVVAVGVIVLMGSVFLLLATNSGARLGFLLALTGLMGWMTLMGVVWSMYGIGYKGPAPTWKVKEINSGNIHDAATPIARDLPEPEDLPNPLQVRDQDEDLTKEFPPDKKRPILGDLITVVGKDGQPTPAVKRLQEQINKDSKGVVTAGEGSGKWRLVPTSDKASGETQAAAAEYLGPDERNLFASASDYVVVEVFTTGGKKPRASGSMADRVSYKLRTLIQRKNPPAYAVVQLQKAIPQTAKPGQAPPPAVADPNAPVISVVLERDLGALRLPSIGLTIFSGVIFAILCNMLHRRDKAVMKARGATPAGAK